MNLHFEYLPSVQTELWTPRPNTQLEPLEPMEPLEPLEPLLDLNEDPFHIPLQYQRLFVEILDSYVDEIDYVGYLDKI